MYERICSIIEIINFYQKYESLPVYPNLTRYLNCVLYIDAPVFPEFQQHQG